MSEENKSYSDEEFALVLKKAAELARGSDDSPRPAAELSLDDMKAVAAEAGLDPALIERAAHFIPSEPGWSLPDRVLGRLGKRRLSASFPITLTQERTARLLSAVRASTEAQGVGEATSSGLVWRIGGVSVTVHQEGGGSRVQVSVNPSRALALAGWLGVFSGWILVGSFEPNTLGALSGCIAGGLGVALGVWAGVTQKAMKRADALMDTIGRTMAEMGEFPAASEEGSGPGRDAEARSDQEPGGA